MIYILLANGFMETETCAPLNILRRCGAAVQLVNVSGSPYVEGSNGLRVIPDIDFADLQTEQAEAIVLPGGMPGASNLGQDERVISLLQQQAKRGGLIAAICAAPFVLGKAGILAGHKACAYPGFEAYMAGVTLCPDLVVEDGQFITANGPSAAFAFGFALASRLCPAENVEAVFQGMQMPQLKARL